jgi:hypothetical protein
MAGRQDVVSPARIETRIFLLRGQKVMLSTHLAELYEVEPRVLVQAVKRNIERFPADFMFQLSAAEYANLKSQFVTSSWGGLRRAAPYAFTEQGVAMLSSVLRSPPGGAGEHRDPAGIRALAPNARGARRPRAQARRARKEVRRPVQGGVRCHPPVDGTTCEAEAPHRLRERALVTRNQQADAAKLDAAIAANLKELGYGR